MIAVLERPKITPAELLERPDRDQYELINGELVERNMGWQSSRIGSKLLALLETYVGEHNLGWVNGADAAYQCYEDALPEDPDRIRKPDVSFIRLERLPPESPWPTELLACSKTARS